MSRSQRPSVLHMIILSSLMLLGTQAPAAADIAAGKKAAIRWCASCHLVSPDQKKASVDAPSFAKISRTRRVSAIKSFLIQSHPQMPNMTLTQSEIDNLILYMQTLAPPIDPVKLKPQKDKPPKQHRG